MANNQIEEELEIEELANKITRMLEHIKIRPTYILLNTVYIILKNYGYKDIPRLIFSEFVPNAIGSNILEQNAIFKYCKDIEELIKKNPNPDQEDKKKNISKEIHMFKESSMLPQNVYVSEKGDEEKFEDNYIEEDVTSETESENSLGSELEQEEEGYEIYEENDEEFSN